MNSYIFALYDNDYHIENGSSRDTFEVICKLFNLTRDDFFEYQGGVSYPCLIDIQLSEEYHGVISFLSPNDIYYTDYNPDRDGDNHLTYKVLDMINDKIEFDHEFLKSFFHIDSFLSFKEIKISIVEIRSYHDRDELLKLIDDTVNFIVKFFERENALEGYDLDFQDAHPMLRDLMSNSKGVEERESIVVISKLLLKNNSSKLKSKIRREYKWI